MSSWECRHSAVLDVDDYADDVPVPSFGPRVVGSCDARPNWADLRARMGTGPVSITTQFLFLLKLERPNKKSSRNC